jgi:ubiquinone/menaquinone biosynthesis C-methylase UbiE
VRTATESNAPAIYTARKRAYLRFIKAVLYPQGLRAFFRSYPLRGSRVLDAGCGTGVCTLALLDALGERGIQPATVDAFDLTPAMLEQFRETLAARGLTSIRLAQADVLELDRLPDDWRDYDLVVSSAMLEYLPRERLPDALAGLRQRLRRTGAMVVFISRRNLAMQWLIRKWWDANLYSRRELSAAFERAGLTATFRRFPFPYWHLGAWGVIVEARAAGGSAHPR